MPGNPKEMIVAKRGDLPRAARPHLQCGRGYWPGTAFRGAGKAAQQAAHLVIKSIYPFNKS